MALALLKLSDGLLNAGQRLPWRSAAFTAMFWSLDIDPPKAERFICNLELGICSFSLYVVL